MGNNTQIENALAAARHVLALRYEGAACAFAAGSIIRGEGTASSDIDLVVVFDRVDRAWRESFVDHGFPVEAFVHDPETLAWFINNDAKSGHPLMLDMIASGTLMGTDVVRADTLQAAARSQLAAGPRPFAGEHCDSIRYQITDLLDDLRGERSLLKSGLSRHNSISPSPILCCLAVAHGPARANGYQNFSASWIRNWRRVLMMRSGWLQTGSVRLLLDSSNANSRHMAGLTLPETSVWHWQKCGTGLTEHPQHPLYATLFSKSYSR